MRIDVKSIILVFLMLVLSLSVATNSLNKNIEVTEFEEDLEPMNVILPIADLNEPGFQEGSIFTDATLSSGNMHTCALLDDGTVSCWGRNQYGALGDGTATDRNTPTQTSSFGSGRTAVAISSGYYHTCAILDDGTVSCWGYNYYGQLGNGGTSNQNTPTLTNSLGTGRTAVAISSKGLHTCAILDDGSVSCWGYNNNGQLGDGTTTWRYAPTQTSSLGTGRTAVAISSGTSHTCAILDDGTASCWGINSNSQLGDGTTTQRNTPTQTSSLGTGKTAVAISSRYHHTCAILDDGSVSCWGRNNQGQLGNGGTSDQSTPTLTNSLGTGRTAIAISPGYHHTCALLDDGSVNCWGHNYYGQLGDGTTTHRNTPNQTSSLGTGRTAVAISSGNDHTCAILDNGDVSCWGRGDAGQLGNGGTSNKLTPTLTSSLGTTANPRTAALSERDFDDDGILNIFDSHQNLDYRETTISSGYYHTCAILDDGSVSCWGSNTYGQLGDGTTTDRNSPTQTSSLGTGRTAVAISTGTEHTCAILDDGSVSCWGKNYYGQLGDGTTTDRGTPTQTSSLGTGRTAVAISSESDQSCAILDDGSVSCWGRNSYGSLGDGTGTNRNTPTQTSSLGTGRTAVAISVGKYFTCVILDDGSVSCWGFNLYRQLGDGTNTHRSTPAQTSSLGTGRTAIAISSGEDHSCAVLDNGSVACWGYNYNGQIGDGTTTERGTPTQTSSLGTGRTAVAISTGGRHTCAILDNANVSCWGHNYNGQLGDGTTTEQLTPTQTSSLGTGRTAVAISSGQSYNCAVLDDASVSCWGYNGYAQLGDGTTTNRNTPTPTSSLGTGRTGLLVDGDLDGDGTMDHFEDFPNNSVRSIACPAGQYGRYLCVDAPIGKYSPASSAMYATDSPGGYFVNQTGQSSAIPCPIGTYTPNTGSSSSSDCDDADAGHYVVDDSSTSVIVDSQETTIAAGGAHTCAILDNGSVACWGFGEEGNLGDGTSTNRNTPTQTLSFGTGRTAVVISTGSAHTCAILDDGSVSCWGWNVDGLIGDGTTTDRNTPTPVSSFGTGRTAVAISSGETHNCAILDDGSVSCWGTGTSGQLGDGNTTNRYTPTQTSSLGTGRTAVALSLGDSHTCALLDNGEVSCWGRGASGQLGNGGTSNQNTPTLTSSLGTGRNAVALSSGSQHTCAILDNGSVSCWGDGSYGKLGNGGSSDKSTPTLTSSLGTTANPRTAVALSPGNQHTCAILDNGSVSCWGYGNSGQLGNGGTSNQNTPTLTTSLGTGRNAVALSSGSQHTCAILDNGSVSCWGNGGSGRLGNGGTSNQNTPTLTSSLGTSRTAAVLTIPNPHTGQISQVGCSLGTYQPLTGQSSCDDADAGSFVNQTAQSTQTPCGIGTFQPLTGQSSCDDADAGNYVDQTNQSSQTPCELGTYQPLTGQTSCDDADAGYYVDLTGQASQTPCGLGTYNPNTASSNSSACGDADSGYFVNQTAQSTQTPCGIGTFQPLTGQVSCDDADAGNYVDQTNQSSQTPCELGTYQPLTGQTSCDDADAGYYVDMTAQASQTPCSIGTYNPNTVSTSSSACGDADSGYFVNQTAQSTQTPCGIGTFQPLTGQSSCDDADAGYYVELTAQPNQIPCELGTYQPLTGQTSCDDADAGYYVDLTGQASQTPCGLGTYNPNTASSNSSACDDADAGYFVNQTAQSAQNPCGVGSYQPLTGQASCDDADAGYYVELTAQPNQIPCELGTYQPLTGQTSCDDADAGYYVDLNGQASQTPCGLGTYNPNTASSNSSACDDADAGYFVNQTAQTNQIPCGIGTYQSLTGQASCDDADAGYYVELTAQPNQIPCELGTYQPLTGQTSCDDADAGYYVDMTAQASQTPCSIGTYNPNTVSTSSSACGDADAGYFVNQTAQSTQTPCGIGTFQSLTGQSSCDDADAGYYVELTAQPNQIPCELGTYQSLTGQTSCGDADAGYYVDMTAQASQTPCSIGTYNPNTVSTSSSACDDADAGYFVNQTAQSAQNPCGVGSYQPMTGQVSCDDADAGYYVELTAQPNQIPCELGTYQPLTGQTSCDDADAGYYVDMTAQTSQLPCELGTYQPVNGQSDCTTADSGYFVGQTAQSGQNPCANGTYQALTGQSSCDDADAGYYVDMTGQASQIPCELGAYQAQTGQVSCDEADAGYYVDLTAQANQIPCELGTYQPVIGQSICIDADAGYYVGESGLSVQTECDLGTSQNQIGQSSCDIAGIGYYVDSTGAKTPTHCADYRSTLQNNSMSQTDCLLDTDSDLIPNIVDDDDDGDGFNDSVDKFKLDINEWNDHDLDGIGDLADLDDDNDGWSDVEEIRAGSDPLSSSDQPVEGFEVIIPGTSISLGAWDLIGMFGGIPLFVWISFGFITRNSRSLKFETRMKDAKNKEELDKISGKIELSLTLRLLGVNQGIRLDKVRSKLTEEFDSNTLENEESSTKSIPVISNLNLSPDVTTPAEQVDGDGYEWLTHSDETKWYRVAQSNSEWTKFE